MAYRCRIEGNGRRTGGDTVLTGGIRTADGEYGQDSQLALIPIWRRKPLVGVSRSLLAPVGVDRLQPQQSCEW